MNFGTRQGGGADKVCIGAWHEICYKQHEKDSFPVLSSCGLDEAIINDEAMEEEDPLWFREARDGDHLMCPFVCDECHFWNLRRREVLVGNVCGELTMVCIRRANLDALWSRERSTVAGNLREGVRYLLICDRLGEKDPYPGRGPWPVGDLFGMKMACALLVRTLDPGKNAEQVQFETVCKLWSHLSNFAHTTPRGMGPAFISDDGCVSALTNSTTNSMWFCLFMQGMHQRMEGSGFRTDLARLQILEGD